MSPAINTFLNGVSLGKGQIHANMTVFPLLCAKPPDLDYLLLDEALGMSFVMITEVSEGGSVPDLKVANGSNKPVLIVEGEEMVGAKQNRIANVTILVGPMQTIVIPVSCVEQGRWHYEQENFRTEGRMFMSRGRARNVHDVMESKRISGEYRADQGAVWDDVECCMDAAGAHSPTGAMSEVYVSRHDRLQEYLQAFNCLDRQAGVLVSIDGRVAGLDLFATPATCRSLFPKLVSSYALDALETMRPNRRHRRPVKAAATFWNGLNGAVYEATPSISLGEDIRFEADTLVGAALTLNQTPLHLCAFPRTSPRSSHDHHPMRRPSQRRERF